MSRSVSLSGKRDCGRIKSQNEGRTGRFRREVAFHMPGKEGKTMNQRERNRALKLYFEEGREAEEIAELLGREPGEIEEALGDPEALDRYRKKSEAIKVRAQIRVNKSAERAARRQAELLESEEKGGTPTVRQRAAKDILDRAGVRLEKEGRGEITIRFISGVPQLGMPRRQEERNDD